MNGVLDDLGRKFFLQPSQTFLNTFKTFKNLRKANLSENKRFKSPIFVHDYLLLSIKTNFSSAHVNPEVQLITPPLQMLCIFFIAAQMKKHDVIYNCLRKFTELNIFKSNHIPEEISSRGVGICYLYQYVIKCCINSLSNLEDPNFDMFLMLFTRKHHISMNPRVGTDTSGPGEAVSAIR